MDSPQSKSSDDDSGPITSASVAQQRSGKKIGDGVALRKTRHGETSSVSPREEPETPGGEETHTKAMKSEKTSGKAKKSHEKKHKKRPEKKHKKKHTKKRDKSDKEKHAKKDDKRGKKKRKSDEASKTDSNSSKGPESDKRTCAATTAPVAVVSDGVPVDGKMVILSKRNRALIETQNRNIAENSESTLKEWKAAVEKADAAFAACKIESEETGLIEMVKYQRHWTTPSSKCMRDIELYQSTRKLYEEAETIYDTLPRALRRVMMLTETVESVKEYKLSHSTVSAFIDLLEQDDEKGEETKKKSRRRIVIPYKTGKLFFQFDKKCQYGHYPKQLIVVTSDELGTMAAGILTLNGTLYMRTVDMNTVFPKTTPWKNYGEVNDALVAMIEMVETIGIDEYFSRVGKIYGICCICARSLSDKESIELGMGPVCKKRVQRLGKPKKLAESD